MTDQELREIEARCDLASPGPWTSIVEGRDQLSGSSFIMVASSGAAGEDIEFIGATADEQDFIARARQDIPRLLAEITRLRSLIPGAHREAPRDEDGISEQELRTMEDEILGIPPGPWTIVEMGDPSVVRFFERLGPAAAGVAEIEVLGATAADREFIAHSREDIPRLIAELRRRTALTTR
ncbi:MAG TPA: hypothetical protein VFJ82_21105 [Longimicrobium sp.]|nr:hypothetical protein [Longimicrobium sp.]